MPSLTRAATLLVLGVWVLLLVTHSFYSNTRTPVVGRKAAVTLASLPPALMTVLPEQSMATAELGVEDQIKEGYRIHGFNEYVSSLMPIRHYQQPQG